MAKFLTTTLLALPLILSGIATASAFGTTPDVAPIPQPRPQPVREATTPAPLPANVVAIGVEPQNVPESRRNVRVVGWKFLPARDESIALAGRDAAEAADIRTAAAKADRVVAETALASALFGVGPAMASAE